LLSQLIWRGLLVAIPFVVWFVWRDIALRTGRPMGQTPWTWLTAAGGLLLGLSLMATALFHEDNRNEAYVPAEVAADGRVVPGHFEQKK
jgi:hypothetical protein